METMFLQNFREQTKSIMIFLTVAYIQDNKVLLIKLID